MSLAKLLPLLLLPLAGCCCSQLSGRYGDIGPSPPMAAPAVASNVPMANCQPCAGCGAGGCGLLPGHAPLLARLHGGHGLQSLGLSGPVPSEQHDDYLSPLPKFHAVPTRPVFEPQPEYAAAVLLDPTPHNREPWSRLGPGLTALAK